MSLILLRIQVNGDGWKVVLLVAQEFSPFAQKHLIVAPKYLGASYNMHHQPVLRTVSFILDMTQHLQKLGRFVRSCRAVSIEVNRRWNRWNECWESGIIISWLKLYVFFYIIDITFLVTLRMILSYFLRKHPDEISIPGCQKMPSILGESRDFLKGFPFFFFAQRKRERKMCREWGHKGMLLLIIDSYCASNFSVELILLVLNAGNFREWSTG